MDTSNSANISLTDLEESRLKSKTARSIKHSLSKAMAEALYQPYTQTQPKPLAHRVKDAGKEFLRHNQTCQWIQFIQEEAELSEIKKEPHQKKVALDREAQPIIRESDTPAIRELGVPLPLSLTTPSPSFEEQLRNVHKQQEVLLEQQHLLEEQMEQQKKCLQLASHHELQPKSISPESSDIKDLLVPTCTRAITNITDSSNGPPTRFRRRLKGFIAQSFAERDEGSIGSLLYNTGSQDFPTDRKSLCMSTTTINSSKRSHEGRQYALSQESGSNISQLLSQLPYCSSLDIMKNASESSATITDTVLADLTLKARKNAHQADI